MALDRLAGEQMVSRMQSQHQVHAQHQVEAVAQCCSESTRESARSKMRAVLSGRSFTLDLRSRGIITLPASLAMLQSLQVWRML